MAHSSSFSLPNFLLSFLLPFDLFVSILVLRINKGNFSWKINPQAWGYQEKQFFFFKGVNKLCRYQWKESKGSWLKTVGVTVTNDTSAYTTTWTPSVGAEIWRPLSKHLPGEFLHTYWELSQCLWGNHSLEKEVKALWDILTWQIPSYISFGSNSLTGFLLLFFSPCTWGWFWDTPLLSPPGYFWVCSPFHGSHTERLMPKHSGILETKSH